VIVDADRVVIIRHEAPNCSTVTIQGFSADMFSAYRRGRSRHGRNL
jgi:hypothetical protein